MRDSWSKAELLKLKQAVDRHGRDWAAVSRDVGSKTSRQCKAKQSNEQARRRRLRTPGTTRHAS